MNNYIPTNQDSLEEMDKFLEMQSYKAKSVKKQKQNRLIISKDIKSLIKRIINNKKDQ